MRLIDADELIEELESYKEYFIGTPEQVDKHNEQIDYVVSILEDAYAINRSCATCRFSTIPYPNLYKCLNTEICLESNQTKSFYCSKWEEKVNV